MALSGIQMIIITHLQKLSNGEFCDMYEKEFGQLMKKGIIIEQGLEEKEIDLIESIYNITLPDPLKQFFKEGLPISKGFYNWRDFQEKNILHIKQVMQRPYCSIYQLAEEVEWCERWGEKPTNKLKETQEIRKKTLKAPCLVPVFSYRYMPVLPLQKLPVISVHELDIIYYGEDLEDYLNIEFGDKKQIKIDFKNIEYIPFWSDIM